MADSIKKENVPTPSAKKRKYEPPQLVNLSETRTGEGGGTLCGTGSGNNSICSTGNSAVISCGAGNNAAGGCNSGSGPGP